MKHTIDLEDILPYLAVLILITILILFGVFVHHAEANQVSHIYPITARVSEIDPATDTVVFEDCMGFRWAMYGIEDWRPGDSASLLMHDSNTATIYDDVIITARYSTWNLSH